MILAEISVQLYSVRRQLAEDYDGVIRRIATMGYDAVETAGMYGAGAAQARALFDSVGLRVSSCHLPLLGSADERAQALDDALALGARYAVVPYIPPDQFGSVEQVIGHCTRINDALTDVEARGMTLLYHNHAWEFTTSAALDDRTPMAIMLDHLDPRVGFEIDVYWAQHAGVNPAGVVASLGDRAPLLHMKDGKPGTSQPMLAAGDGDVDLAAVARAGSAAWWIAELDEHDGDMLLALERSAAYLKSLAG
jgi:sugar phosphate isomerase/epimerase